MLIDFKNVESDAETVPDQHPVALELEDRLSVSRFVKDNEREAEKETDRDKDMEDVIENRFVTDPVGDDVLLRVGELEIEALPESVRLGVCETVRVPDGVDDDDRVTDAVRLLVRASVGERELERLVEWVVEGVPDVDAEMECDCDVMLLIGGVSRVTGARSGGRGGG